MSGEPPTQYENYPHSSEPANSPAPNRWTDPPAPAPLVVRAYQPSGPTGASSHQASRRGVIAGVAGIAVLGGLVMIADVGTSRIELSTSSGEDTEPSPIEDDPFDDSADEPSDQSYFEFGGNIFDLPEGWQSDGAADYRALLSNGRNQLLVVAYGNATGSAAEELVDALNRSNTPFTGSTGKVKKTTNASGIDRATAKGSGKYEGRAARQIVDLFLLSGAETALFARQILTAAEGSSIANQAGRLLADLRDYWP